MGTVYRLTLRQLSGRWRLLDHDGAGRAAGGGRLLMLRSATARPRSAEFEQVVF